MRREFDKADAVMERSNWRTQATEQEEMRMKGRWVQREVETKSPGYEMRCTSGSCCA